MGEEDDITRLIERLAAEMGIDAKCRLMHRAGFEDGGEWFPPYSEYETRANGKWLCIDASVSNANQLDAFIRLCLEDLR